MPDRVRSLFVALALLGCLSGPVLELFDQWDQPLQSATDDTEANVLIVAMCVGLALIARRALAVIRLRSTACLVAERLIFCQALDRLLIPARLDIRPHALPLRV